MRQSTFPRMIGCTALAYGLILLLVATCGGCSDFQAKGGTLTEINQEAAIAPAIIASAQANQLTPADGQAVLAKNDATMTRWAGKMTRNLLAYLFDARCEVFCAGDLGDDLQKAAVRFTQVKNVCATQPANTNQAVIFEENDILRVKKSVDAKRP